MQFDILKAFALVARCRYKDYASPDGLFCASELANARSASPMGLPNAYQSESLKKFKV